MRARTISAIVLGVVLSVAGLRLSAAPPATGPSIDDLIALKRPGTPALSPDSRWVAYTVRQANWDDDRYDTQIWIADARSGGTRQLTTAPRSSTAPAWSPDGRHLAFASDRAEHRQIYVIDPSGGEAQALTSAAEGVGAFKWSPDGRSIAYAMTDPAPDALKAREKTYGLFDVIGQEHRMTHLYVVDVGTKASRQVTKGAFTVGSFDWSPDGTQIAFDHRINSDNANSGTADISVVSVADETVRPLVTQDGPDTAPVWSPDGTRIVFESKMANPSFFYTNTMLASIPAGGGPIDNLTAAFDEDASVVAWTPAGILFSAAQRTSWYLFRLDPATKHVAKLLPADGTTGSGFSVSANSGAVAYVKSAPGLFSELYVAGLDGIR